MQFGLVADCLIQLGTAQTVHWRADHAPGQLRRSVLYLLQRQGAVIRGNLTT
jgi:hypothetical protein